MSGSATKSEETQGTGVSDAVETSTEVTIGSALGEKHIESVLNALKSVNDWQTLGLKLGILYSTLEKIGENCREQIDPCKRKMIYTWLKEKPSGVPTFAVLKIALKDMDENAAADNIVF